MVKAVKFLPRTAGDEGGVTYLVTGSDDKTVKIWSLQSSSDNKSKDVTTPAAECIQTVQSHTGPVNCIASLSSSGSSLEPENQRMFATGAADATVKIWTFDGTEARVLQTFKPTPKFFPLAIAISRLHDTTGGGEGNGSPLILAVAGTRDTIQLFVADSLLSPEFKHQATLSGHEGWIRSLDFVREPRQVEAGSGSEDAGDLLLASASQDKYIRLWRFHRGTELPTIKAEGNDPSLGAYLPGRSPSNKVHRLKTGSGSDSEQQEYSVTFEALLLGHDDWIYSAKWFVRRDTQNIEKEANQDKQQPDARLQLLSTSADNTLTIWEADPDSGIWLSAVRLGEISREKGATTATGSTGGFWTGLWSADGNSVTCLGRTGSWRVWNYSEKDDQWVPQVGIGGHTKAVTGVAWAKNGDYLLSTSLDQTTRLHASWKRSRRAVAEAEAEAEGEGDTRGEDEREETWHEMSRPQIHGYDLNCIDTLGGTSFVSGADEKLMRVFHEPKAVANLLETLSGITAPGGSGASALPDAANMPVLGLSNKAIEAVDDDAELDPAASNPHDNNADREALDPGTTVRKSLLSPTSVTHPPMEDSLSRHTLWPETEKLYGHGYEISCLAASHDGKLIASACRASSLNHAVIRLFETERWTEIRPPLAAHTLTATRIRWSADDRHLLSVGRDRAWAVFERDPDSNTEGPLFKLKQTNPKGHTRMILDAAWAPSPSLASIDSLGNNSSTRLVFATAGRDKQVKLWHTQQTAPPATSEEAAAAVAAAGGTSEIVLAGSIPETHPVTAIDFIPHTTTADDSSSGIKHFILAVGTEAGKITVHRIDAVSLSLTSSIEVGSGLCLAKAVLQLSWRPRRDVQQHGEDGGESEKVRRRSGRDELVVAGDDGSLRVYSFRL